MRTSPRVSVIMAAYNEERFLGEAVESVLAQSFDDFELIVTDDGSTDATAALAQSFVERDPRVRLVRGERNQGKPFALNRALAIRRGELIAWLDGDDVMLPQKLARQVAVLDANPDAAGCSHDAEMFQSEDGSVIGRFSAVANGAPLRSGGIELWFDPTYKMLPSATMIRSALCPPGGFDERLSFTNDWLFDIEVFRHGRCVALDDVLVRYRRHADNFTTRAEQSGASYEEGLMAMAIVTARYPQLQRRARKMSTAILLGQARRRLTQREWRDGVAYALAAAATGGPSGLAGVAVAMARSRGR
ncbi:MAG TPA: glycosyltransferase family 2 protein [Solirubrobacteraceae bacterium]|nr:glycosyltransferase family 2 protein [Solirubrobacteraceae bacterium]